MFTKHTTPVQLSGNMGAQMKLPAKKNAVNAGLRRKKVLLRLSYMIQKCMAEIPKVLQ
jgi:hypothetical protein